jgi:hypothetical protein
MFYCCAVFRGCVLFIDGLFRVCSREAALVHDGLLLCCFQGVYTVLYAHCSGYVQGKPRSCILVYRYGVFKGCVLVFIQTVQGMLKGSRARACWAVVNCWLCPEGFLLLWSDWS